MEKKPYFSVIIHDSEYDSYNKKNLFRSIKSVMNQDYKNFELIVITHSSNQDEIKKLSKGLSNKILFIKNQNFSNSKIKNESVKLTSGNWICFIDTNEMWNHKKLSIQSEYIIANPEIEAIHTNETFICYGKNIKSSTNHTDEYDNFNENLDKNTISLSAISMTKKLYYSIDGFDEEMEFCEAYDLWLKLITEHQVGFIPEVLSTKFGNNPQAHPSMERFQIYSLLKVILDNSLDRKEKICTQKKLVEKVMSLEKRLKKYGKSAEEIEKLSAIILRRMISENQGLKNAKKLLIKERWGITY